MNVILGVSVFILGTIIGSFLNVVICRFNTGRSPLAGRSCCFSCGKQLRFYELIPLVSYFVQNRKCRTCDANISGQYAAVEAITGFIFLAVFAKLGFFVGAVPVASLLFWWTVVALFMIITVYDLRHTIIPDTFVYLLVLMGLGNLIARQGGLPDFMTGLLIALFFFVIWFVSRGRAMGLGDAKLAIAIGWLLPWSMALTAVILGVWIGALVGLVLLMLRSRNYSLSSELPFAPFLAIGTLLTFVCSISLF